MGEEGPSALLPLFFAGDGRC